MNQKGVITLAVPLLLLLVAAAVIFILISYELIKFPYKVSLPGKPKEPTVELQKQYQNPFDKSTQYVNPFSSYKNPFDQLK